MYVVKMDTTSTNIYYICWASFHPLLDCVRHFYRLHLQWQSFISGFISMQKKFIFLPDTT